METVLTEEQITKAVDWWRNALSNPKFSAHSEKERASGHDNLALAEVMATVLAHDKKGKEEEGSLDRFCDELGKNLRENPPYGLNVDYHPDMTLYKAAKKSGFKGEFPWKTNMWFRDGKVEVSYGYGVETVEV